MDKLFPKVEPYPAEVLALQTHSGFREAVLGAAKYFGGNQKEAFYFVNDEFERLYSTADNPHGKYSDYSSYMVQNSKAKKSYYDREDFTT